MQFDKVFRVLLRNDVKELALQTDRPPCALMGESWTAVVSRNLTEDEVIAALVETGGRAEVVSLMDGPRQWDFALAEVGVVRVAAGYRGTLLQARFRLLSPLPVAPVAVPAPVAVHAPAAAPAAGPPIIAPMPPAGRQETRASLGRPSFSDAHAPAMPAASDAYRRSLPEPQATPEIRGRPSLADTRSANELPRVASQGDPRRLLEDVLDMARARRASDLHVVAERPVKLRVAGELVAVSASLDAALVMAMIESVLPERAKHDLEATGATDFAFRHPTHGRFRANVTRQRTGWKLTARPIADRVSSLAELGLPESIAAATAYHQGLIVVTGPTGHGKTTTMAAIVDVLNRAHTHHIITVEDPIEYIHERKRSLISQREVGTHTKSFAAALKGSLREDPDVIVVGELRDTDTVRMALSASETGHLVISTMNTPSAAKTIERLIDLFPPGDQPQVRMSLAGGLRLVVSQRLVPSTDRTAVHVATELLPGLPALWALIRDNKTFQIPSLQQRGKSLGIVRLDDSLAELVRAGKTTLEQAQRFSESPEQFEALVTGRTERK